LFRVTNAARRFLLQEGTDIKYGARHLKRAIEKFVVYPLASLLATEQIWFGDILVIDWDEEDEGISFHREGRGAVIPAPPRRRARSAAVRSAASVSGADKTRVAEPELEPSLSR
jgi:hypothetical protein